MCLSLGYGFLKNTLVDNILHKIANHDPVVFHSIKPTLIGHSIPISCLFNFSCIFSLTLLKAKAIDMLIDVVTMNSSKEN